MYFFILFTHIFIGIIIVVSILLQRGKGATGGIILNNMSNLSGGMFDNKVSSIFLLRLTMFFSFLFIITSLVLCQMNYKNNSYDFNSSDILKENVISDIKLLENTLIDPS